MPKPTPQAPRERYREQIRTEVKAHAWNQIATAGASALSLNAIAKQMGMSGPALYRYYASRDELITELIADAYRSLANALHHIADKKGDLAALAHGVRTWGLEDPHRYLLIYGTPIPGYHAPPTTTAISSEIMKTLLTAATATPTTPDEIDAHLAHHRAWAGDDQIPTTALHKALTFWTRVHGALSLELTGHLDGMDFDPGELFAAEVRSLMS
ncbi:TetR/AcrR family transcriptional regulator [Catenulispora yoronensis]|uniref:TetR/AcrR family transcriptional regulator n=1 Tax=Catenulispora yoronensis TaxID=450799 RepID=A0ABP5GRT9_9ACTN